MLKTKEIKMSNLLIRDHIYLASRQERLNKRSNPFFIKYYRIKRKIKKIISSFINIKAVEQ